MTHAPAIHNEVLLWNVHDHAYKHLICQIYVYKLYHAFYQEWFYQFYNISHLAIWHLVVQSEEFWLVLQAQIQRLNTLACLQIALSTYLLIQKFILCRINAKFWLLYIGIRYFSTMRAEFAAQSHTTNLRGSYIPPRLVFHLFFKTSNCFMDYQCYLTLLKRQKALGF